jgi:hypothetical protein
MSARYEAQTTRAYIKRQRAKGIEPTADEIWALINRSWPGLTAEEKEQVFQAAEPRRVRGLYKK